MSLKPRPSPEAVMESAETMRIESLYEELDLLRDDQDFCGSCGDYFTCQKHLEKQRQLFEELRA